MLYSAPLPDAFGPFFLFAFSKRMKQESHSRCFVCKGTLPASMKHKYMMGKEKKKTLEYAR